MIKNLVKHGNSWALVIDKPILELLKIDPESPLEISTDGQVLTVTAAGRQEKKAALRAASEKVNAKHKKAFKKLAE
ncbi:hypothetical protein [Bremerella sp.]|jgi:antitoxin component of MazEF toxin-antitoxin module|uniref:hypothetical protein n=1 Tax=Bremerella sp. TaxID=2795602 RepID=UPI00391DFAA1